MYHLISSYAKKEQLATICKQQWSVQTVLVCMCTTNNFCQATFIPQLAKA